MAHAQDQVPASDADGVARVPMARAALWNVRTIHLVPADQRPRADWDVHGATFVFGVEPAAGLRGRGSGTADARR